MVLEVPEGQSSFERTFGFAEFPKSQWEERRRRMEKGSVECSDSMREGKKGQNSRLKRQSEVLQSEAEKIAGYPRSNEPEEVTSSEDDYEDTNSDTENDERTRFDNFCQSIRVMVQWKMGKDMEDLFTILESEKSTYQENVWRDGPDHAHLAAVLKLLNLSPEEWTVSVSRMDPTSMASSLTTAQVHSLKRLDEGAHLSSVLLKSGPRPGGPSESWGKLEVKGSKVAMDSDSCKGPDSKRIRKSVALQSESKGTRKMTKQI